MSKDQMHYGRMVDTALRGVVRDMLTRVRESGLPGAHHFYISFRTGDPGVVMPDGLRAKYRDEMTIVLQHQFWGLEVGADYFEVTLSFNKLQQRLHIPFRAMTGFFDPSVQFGLQFQPLGADGEAMRGASLPVTPAAPVPLPPGTPEEAENEPAAGADGEAAGDDKDKIVSLDLFRKK
jgi:hypothetical protein